MRKFPQIARGSISAVCWGYGIYFLLLGLQHEITRFNGAWALSFFFVVFTLVFAAVWLALGYFVYRRDYRNLVMTLASVAGVILLGSLISLPRYLGVVQLVDRYVRENPWLGLFAFIFSIFCLFAPFYVMLWFLRSCARLADRYLPRSGRGIS